MAYFSNMPVFNYPFVVNERTEYINSRNIMVRAKFLDYVKNTQTAYLNYIVRDGERPETLAQRVYGSSDLHWVILLFNEILDPFFTFPMSSADLARGVDKKYEGVTLFVDMKSVKFTKNGVVNKANEELWYEVGSTITQGNATGIVKLWDPNLYKIVVEQTSNATFSISDGVQTPTNTNLDLIQVRNDGVAIYSAIGRVVAEDKYSVHHFVDSETGDVVDHHALITDALGDLVDSSVINRYAVFGQEVIPLANLVAVSVSNFQYETEKNDALRSIKMMRPELMDLVIKDMRKVFVG